MDFRKEWFKNRILLYFGETDVDMLDNFLKRDNNRMEIPFQAFLNDSPETIVDIWKQVFVVYRTYYSRMVEEEVEVQEEVTKQRSSSMFGQEDKKKDKKGKKKKKGKKAARIEEEDDDDGDADMYADLQDPYYEQEEDDKRGRKKKKFGKSGRSSPSTMMENVPVSERRGKQHMVTSYVTVKKKIQKVVQVPQLQGYFGTLENDTIDPQNSYVYFIKKLSRAVPRFSSMEEANTKIPEYFVIGSLTGEVFENLHQLLNYVYLPLVQNQIVNYTPGNGRSTGEAKEENVELEGITLERRASWYFMRKHIEEFQIPKDEFQTSLKPSLAEQLKYFIHVDEQKTRRELLDRLIDLINTIRWAENELRSERRFPIPESFSQTDDESAEVNEEMVQKAKDTVQSWIQKIETNLADQAYNAVAGLDLLNEYEYWEKEAIKLGSAVDELHAPATIRVANILKSENFDIYEEFEKKRNSLKLLYHNSKETAAVLYTLRYFFKILAFGQFVSITKIVPTMMESLQSVWILSKYYGEERNMERILINIKSTLCRRVKSSFDVTSLFGSTYAELSDKFQSAIDMLRTWKSSYLDVRTRIECSREYFITRWEFDKSKLFAETDYIGTVIRDLKNIFEVIQRFQNLLDTKFKKLMNSTDLKTITEKIANLSIPIEKVDFDIYLEIFRDEWQEVLEIFEENVIEVDQRLKLLIIKMFSQIRSVKDGIEIVEDISRTETRQTVLDSLPYISNKIIAQFAKEMKVTDQIFDKNKSNEEDTFKIYQLVHWARELVENLRQTLLQLELVAALSTTSQYNEVKCQFDVFNKKVDNYITVIYKGWCRRVIQLINEMFKENVIEIEEAEKSVDLTKIRETKRPRQSTTTGAASTAPKAATYPDRELGLGALTFTLKWIAKSKINTNDHLADQNVEMSKHIEKAHKISWLEFVGNRALIERGLQFRIKVKNGIFDIVKEANCLRDDGFPLPEEIHEFLVLARQLLKKIEYIQWMVAKYNTLVSELEPAQILLMKQHLLDTEMAIQPGLTWYTWKSTVLDTYCAKATKKLQQFASLHYQMQQIFKKLDDFVANIESMNFFPMQGDNLANVQCKEFFHIIDDLQNQEVEKCVSVCDTISLALIQLESLAQYTNTAKSTLMAHFYDTYEKKISAALKRAVLKSISNLERLFNGELNARFSIKLYLENGDLKLQPSCDELQELVKVTINRIFSRLKRLKRWEYGSCIVDSDDNQFFYQILTEDDKIKERNSSILRSLQIVCESLTQSAEEWLKYSMLWKYDKNAKIAEFASKNPQLNDYEMQFDFYSNIISKIEDEKPVNGVFYVDIEVNELKDQLKTHCTEWKHGLGRQLSLDTMQIILRIEQTIKRLSQPLNAEITDLEDLTNALTSINEIQQTETDVQIEFYKIQEHYHELRMQSLKLKAEDLTRFDKLKHDWKLLTDRALYKKFALEPAKIATSDAMLTRIAQFEEKCREFLSAYAADNEKLTSSDFDTCVELITKFSEWCSNLYNRKLELENIHECFEIQPIEFDDFLRAKSELESLKAKFLIF